MHALLFPGQGSQRKGMGEGLFDDYPELTRTADQVLGYSIRDLCLDDQGGRLQDTRYAQPAIFFVNALAALRLTAESPDAYGLFAGHSLGEYNALVAAGQLEIRPALELVKKRAQLMSQVRGGAMAAVTGLTSAQVTEALKEARIAQVHVAGRNTDLQTTVAGDARQMERAAAALIRAGARGVNPLRVSGPFHTPLMRPAATAFARVLGRHTFAPGTGTVVSSVHGEVFDHRKAADLLSSQLAEPVEWVTAVRTLRALGVDRFEEVNGTALGVMVQQVR